MSRSAAARTQHHDERALRRPRPHGAAHARRVSGPAHPAPAHAHPAHPAHAHPARSAEQTRAQIHQPAYAPAGGHRMPAPRPAARPIRPVRPLRLVAGGAAIALRVADSAVNVSGSRTMDRLVRSRAWVVIIGIGLIGIVAMQVSMLKLNSGISRAVDTVATLERSNASLKAEVSRRSAGDRIQTLAGQRGFLMPEPADVTYLRAGDKRSDGFRAARRMHAPDPAIAGPAGAVIAIPDALMAATDATTDPAGVAGTAATTGTTAPGTTSAPAATTLPAATATAPPTAIAPTATGAVPAPVTTPAPTTPTAATGATGATGTPAPTASQTIPAGGVTTP